MLLLAAPLLRAQDEPAVGKFSLESEFRFATVGESNFKERGNIGSIDSYNIDTRNVLSTKVREGFLIRFGLEFDRTNFQTNDTPALPSKFQEINAIVGADLQLGDAWLVRFELQPGFYGAGKAMRGRDIDIPIVLGASYFVSADLQLVAGLSIDQERKYPVLPGLGFRYKCSSDVVLDFILPQPRVEYTLNKSILLYAGADLQSSSYRMEANFGDTHGDPRLNNAIVDYEQIRVGAGASWKIRPALTLELEAGFVPIQEFDYHRADVKARATDTPPYGGISLKASF